MKIAYSSGDSGHPCATPRCTTAKVGDRAAGTCLSLRAGALWRDVGQCSPGSGVMFSLVFFTNVRMLPAIPLQLHEVFHIYKMYIIYIYNYKGSSSN